MAEEVIQELDDGLVLRAAKHEDAERLTAFNVAIHGGDQMIDRVGIEAWMKDLFAQTHPTYKPGDFLLVEDCNKGNIVSSMNLISQTWEYEGIPFKVGRIELVGTAPEYRRRGLIRAQFEVIHRWSQERGELVQAITGIPNYYRQFGYEMALELSGGRIGYPENIPELPAGEEESFGIRPATEADLVFLSDLYHKSCCNSLVSCFRDLKMWQYELNGKCEKSIVREEIRIITNRQGESVGFLSHPNVVSKSLMALQAYYLLPSVSWWEVTPSVMRYLYRTGQAYAARDQKTCSGIYFCLGENHPVYSFYAHRLPKYSRSYAFYLRVPDLAEFLMTIKPVLEQRLAEGIRSGYSGELNISFYYSGIGLVFENGHLLTVKPLLFGELATANASFPHLTFLQVLFGYHTLADIQSVFPDCLIDDDKARPLLSVLFPQKGSQVWPIA